MHHSSFELQNNYMFQGSKLRKQNSNNAIVASNSTGGIAGTVIASAAAVVGGNVSRS